MVPVRLLTADDAAAFRDIRLEGLAAEPRAFSADWGDESQRDLDWFAARIATNEIFATADGGRLLGVMGLAIPANPKLAHRGQIWGVYVRPEARGRGMAAALLDAAIAAARGRVESLHLGVGVYNEAARRRYRAAGFIETGFEPRMVRVGDDFIDEINMTMLLT